MSIRERVAKQIGSVLTGSLRTAAEQLGEMFSGLEARPPEPEALIVELGSTGLKNTGGMIVEEFVPELRGLRGINTFTEMWKNDPVLGSVAFAIQMLCRQVPWHVEAASADPLAEEAADFLTSCMDDMSTSWSGMISEILSMIVYGFSFHEIVYKLRAGPNSDAQRNSDYNDGRIGWRKIAMRGQDTIQSWDISDDGGINGLIQCGPPRYQSVYIPIEKALLFRGGAYKNNPQGDGIFRHAYRPWKMKKHIENVEAIGVERELAGLPVLEVPIEILQQKTDEARASYVRYKDLLNNIKFNEQSGVMIPLDYNEQGNPRYKLSLISTGGRRAIDTGPIIQRYSQQEAMCALADFILLGHEKVGSFALSSSKTHLFSTAIGSYLDEIRDVFNMHAIPRLMRFNPEFPPDIWPSLAHGDIETPDLTELAAYITALAGIGVEIDDNLEDHLRRAGNLPPKGSETL